MGSISKKPVIARMGALLVPAAALLLFAGQPAHAQPAADGPTAVNARTGTVSPSAINRLCHYTSAQPLLRPGSYDQGLHSAVKQAQCEITWTIRGTTVAEDGIFGPKTLAAVKQVQRCAHISVDGIIGPKTWAVINSYSSTSAWLC